MDFDLTDLLSQGGRITTTYITYMDEEANETVRLDPKDHEFSKPKCFYDIEVPICAPGRPRPGIYRFAARIIESESIKGNTFRDITILKRVPNQ